MEDYLKKAIEQMKNGDEKGFNTLYSATYNRVYFRAKQIMKRKEDAQDLTQIVFLEAYKNIGTLQQPEAFYGWLDSITYRQGMKIYRKNNDVLLREEAEDIFEEIESNDLSSMPELTADQQATADIIKGILEELPELQRIAVVAYYFDSLKIEQIAKMMECSVNTIKSRLSYARKYIKNRIEEKEKEEGYRLHVFTLPVLWYALKKLSAETVLSADEAQKIYNGACSEAGLQAMTLLPATPPSHTGNNMSIPAKTGSPMKNILIAGVSFGLSFAATFAVQQIIYEPIEIITLAQAYAILDEKNIQVIEEESGKDTAVEINAEQKETLKSSQKSGQETAQETMDESVEDVEELIYFDWSFDDWRYNGVHISEGFDAVARSFGLDPTLETDYKESELYGTMRLHRFEESYISDEKYRVWYSVLHDSMRILMSSGIIDENGNPVNVSDITSVPFSAGTKEEAENFFHIPEIMKIGEKKTLGEENGIEMATYQFTSNLGKGELFVGWSKFEDEVSVHYNLSFPQNGESYSIDIGYTPLSGSNEIYYTKYNYYVYQP